MKKLLFLVAGIAAFAGGWFAYEVATAKSWSDVQKEAQVEMVKGAISQGAGQDGESTADLEKFAECVSKLSTQLAQKLDCKTDKNLDGLHNIHKCEPMLLQNSLFLCMMFNSNLDQIWQNYKP